ncbi:MAG: helix-turn-helix domain-containing protein [Verrucomicrobia bacterium]|nr:helix-turn-helix domain-containing protein [Verrucomicrobiota bacterium]MCH8513563.1 helix-turn-helix domain-containing protein [Kiritimatiellia bacterium]
MAKKGIMKIGVVTPAAIGLGRDILLGVRAYCDAHPQCELKVISSRGDIPEGKATKFPVDCIVYFSSDSQKIQDLLLNCPRVVSTSNQHRVTLCPQVVSDDVQVGQLAARKFIERGHRNLVFIGPGHLMFSQQRQEGFEAAAREKGCEISRLELDDGLEVPGVLKALSRMHKPMGLFCASDLHARWIMENLQNPAKMIPAKYAMIGVDNDPLEQALCPMGLSSVMLAGRQIGFQAAKIGREWTEGKPPPTVPMFLAPLGIVSRQSTRTLVYENPMVTRCIKRIEETPEAFADVADLVRELKVPRRTLELHFEKETGMGVGGHLRAARIRKASDLLGNTELSMKEISYLVGFSEPRMLSLVFKRETGETPSQFRSRVRGQSSISDQTK